MALWSANQHRKNSIPAVNDSLNERRAQIRAACLHSPMPDDAGGVTTPICRATTYRFTKEALSQYAASEARDVWLYSRYGNPTVRALEHKLAAIEHSEDALATASGMSAISAVLFAYAKPADRWLVAKDLYGVTYSLLNDDLRRFGVEIEFFDATEPSAARALAGSGKPPRLIYWETISNPVVRIAALPELAALAREIGAVSVVDNTFATPWHCLPLLSSVDFVVESGTKYLNGHSDVICGMVAGGRERLLNVWRQMTRLGGCLDPGAAYLWERGLATFPLRIERITANAKAVAAALLTMPDVAAVYYPGVVEPLPGFLGGGGGVVAFRVAGGDVRAERLLEHCSTIVAATSLGGVESLISLPHNTSHVQFTPEQRAAMGILPGTVRLAIGTEAVEEIIEDLQRALRASE